MAKTRQILWLWWLVFLMGGLAACGSEAAPPPTAVGRNGIPIAPEFVDFYNEHGGRRVLGDPISEQFVAEEKGRALQYFQNVRLEYDAAARQVVVTPLGQWALEGLIEPVAAPLPTDGPVRTFASTPFTVQDEFLTFYDDHDGETFLGRPISQQLNVDDLRVQYFENGRLEWRPEAPTELRVQLSPLGQAHFDSEMRFTYQESRDARPVSSAGVSSVLLEAYVKAPILYGGETQILYVTTLTPGGDPVTDLMLDLTLSYGTTTQTATLGPTDDKGQIAFPLPLSVPPGERVTLRVQARSSSGDVIGEAVTAYKTWW
ncbi:MAG: hypothetical protein H6659_04230 [Ardenticatenaceae bacterium]|nr:hypothetical protein [Ardenticatenaceae bacterium]MCB8986461.1 hypothetical protein [Ardenticatenaceae bacterium]